MREATCDTSFHYFEENKIYGISWDFSYLAPLNWVYILD